MAWQVAQPAAASCSARFACGDCNYGHALLVYCRRVSAPADEHRGRLKRTMHSAASTAACNACLLQLFTNGGTNIVVPFILMSVHHVVETRP
jgi:hypothetical protein